MANSKLKSNTAHVGSELEWLSTLVRRRLELHFGLRENIMGAPEPPLFESESVYSQYVQSFNLSTDERTVLILALMPYTQPCLVERILQELNIDNRDIPELGGLKGSRHPGLLPTAETALFILAGNDLLKRMECSLLFSPRHKFNTCGILKLEELHTLEPEFNGALSLSKDVIAALTSGTVYHPPFNSSFPAKLITTGYNRDHLVLHPETEKGLQEIALWLEYRQTLMDELGFANRISPGYKTLFYGPSGTGKSLAAAILGKQHQCPVYRVDLSMVVSKYIGETEKNISNIFNLAEGKNWILFFDEADALFGRRSVTQTAQDRFANQEVSHLLMRMEEYSGLAILATNFRQNMDKAFLRRFDSIVHFPAPSATERLKLWSQSVPNPISIDNSVQLEEIAKNFSLTGANIMNVVRYASIMTLQAGHRSISQSHLLEGIRRELAKEQILTDQSIAQ